MTSKSIGLISHPPGVDQTHKFSNLLEDLRKLGRFAQLLPAAEVIILNC